jgi:hypothetical protein
MLDGAVRSGDNIKGDLAETDLKRYKFVSLSECGTQFKGFS